jgi:hypothetical protein
MSRGTGGMTGQRAGLQERLFYEFRLDDWVPADRWVPPGTPLLIGRCLGW